MARPVFPRTATAADAVPGFPDPFAVATINGEQTKTTTVTKRTLNPYWNENFDLYVVSLSPAVIPHVATDSRAARANEDSILAVQVFDQKKFKKKDQGFLGVINIRIGDIIELTPDADGTPQHPIPPCSAANRY